MAQLDRTRRRASATHHHHFGSEGTDMTLIDTLPPRYAQQSPVKAAPRPVRRRIDADQARRRPMEVRPPGAPVRRRGTGVPVSRAPHRRRRTITPVTTVGLALLAALITVWLGAVAQFGEAIQGATVPTPSKLAVVQVKTGETLQTVAARIAPDAPVGQTVQQIRELNKLESVALTAGQTLIAPVG